MLKNIILLIALLGNGYIGGYFLLNVLKILQSSKYSRNATLLYAILFSSLSVTGLVALLQQHNLTLAIWSSVAPWLLALVFLFLNLIFGDYK